MTNDIPILTWGAGDSSALDEENWNRPAFVAVDDEVVAVGGTGAAAGRGPKIWTDEVKYTMQKRV